MRKLTPELSIFVESLFARWNYLCQKKLAKLADYIQEGRAEAETNEVCIFVLVWDKVKGDRWFILDTSGHWIINNTDDPSLSHHKYMKPVLVFPGKNASSSTSSAEKISISGLWVVQILYCSVIDRVVCFPRSYLLIRSSPNITDCSSTYSCSIYSWDRVWDSNVFVARLAWLR